MALKWKQWQGAAAEPDPWQEAGWEAAGRALHSPGRTIRGQLQPRKRPKRQRDARQRLQEEHGKRNRCCTHNPPRAARIAIKNSHILD